MPEYAVAVDIYGSKVHVAEYKAPPGVAEEAAARRLEEVRAALPTVFESGADDIVFKQRRRQRGARRLVLIGRRGAHTDDRKAAVRALRAEGVERIALGGELPWIVDAKPSSVSVGAVSGGLTRRMRWSDELAREITYSPAGLSHTMQLERPTTVALFE